jgi:endonuclease YncB( thermonuclease family)
MVIHLRAKASRPPYCHCPCQEKDRDRYGRIVAICRASGEDLGAIMVREGFAWAFTRFSVDYVDQQEEARRANRGVHAHDCVPAWEWRAEQRAKTTCPLGVNLSLSQH